MTDRKSEFCQKAYDASGVYPHNIANLIEALRHDDDLMSEMMAVCARTGPSGNDSDLEFIGETGDPLLQNVWLHSGSGLRSTHHLPEPANP